MTIIESTIENAEDLEGVTRAYVRPQSVHVAVLRFLIERGDVVVHVRGRAPEPAR